MKKSQIVDMLIDSHGDGLARILRLNTVLEGRTRADLAKRLPTIFTGKLLLRALLPRSRMSRPTCFKEIVGLGWMTTGILQFMEVRLTLGFPKQKSRNHVGLFCFGDKFLVALGNENFHPK